MKLIRYFYNPKFEKLYDHRERQYKGNHNIIAYD